MNEFQNFINDHKQEIVTEEIKILKSDREKIQAMAEEHNISVGEVCLILLHNAVQIAEAGYNLQQKILKELQNASGDA